MQQNRRRQFQVGIWALTCWSAFQGGIGLAQGVSTATATGTALMFNAESGNAPLSQLQVVFNRAITTVPTENTVLAAEAFGPVMVRSSLGAPMRLDRYVWSVDPSSRMYWGRSGYKSVVALYQYGETKQSLKYTLNIYCQTVSLLDRNKAVCLLSGNGPLLQADVKATGELSLDAVDGGTMPVEGGTSVSNPSDGALFPEADGVDLSGVQTLAGDNTPNAQIEQAIADAVPGYVPNTGNSRYMYNRIDL
ncbi:MAG: hypothetical protein WCD18_01670, partial [Thermosynechococcaceae cyanobacterium]